MKYKKQFTNLYIAPYSVSDSGLSFEYRIIEKKEDYRTRYSKNQYKNLVAKDRKNIIDFLINKEIPRNKNLKLKANRLIIQTAEEALKIRRIIEYATYKEN